MTSTQKNWKEKHQKVGIKCQTSKAYKGGCFEIVRYIFSEVSLFSGSSSRHKVPKSHYVHWDQKCPKSKKH